MSTKSVYETINVYNSNLSKMKIKQNTEKSRLQALPVISPPRYRSTKLETYLVPQLSANLYISPFWEK